MARVLTIVERRVPATERESYFAALESRRRSAAARRAHFWIFEHADEAGRFVEFTEGADANDIAAVHDGELPAPLWREVQGG
jgi:hypothetical protein